jgi:hypothetical protein
VRRSIQMRHFAVVGIAASFLVAIMTTGLLSLLYLANHGQQGPTVSSARITGAQAVGEANVAQLNVNAENSHIASACASNNKIYYSAHNEDASNWSLEVFDQQSATHTTANSTPLLASDSRPDVVLGCTDNWLLWLQMNATSHKNTGSSQKTNTQSSQDTTSASSTDSAQLTQPLNKLSGAWSLKALYIGATTNTTQPTVQDNNKNNQNNNHNNSSNNSNNDHNNNAANKTQTQPGSSTNTQIQPLTLHSDTFTSSAEPTWVTTPIQGVSFYQDHALVTYLDNKGSSHLLDYHFTKQNVTESKEIAHAETGHVLTSPTATTDGHSIYWSEEWYTNDHGLSSNIWTRQETSAPADTGRFTPHLQAQVYQYRDDDNSFRPQIVDNTLFLINKDPETIIQPGPAATSAASTAQAATTPTATVKAQGSTTATSNTVSATATVPAQQDISQYLGNLIKVDPTIYTPQIDENVTGKLQAFVATGTTPATTTIDDNQIVAGLYGGASYLIWKDSNGKYTMYDVRNKAPVGGIADIDKDAAFASISGNTVIWTRYIAPANQNNQPNTNNNTTTNQVTFTVLKWPR